MKILRFLGALMWLACLPAMAQDEPDLNLSLIMAADSGNTQRVTDLIMKGADVNTFTEAGVTPLMYACQNNNQEVAEILLRYGAKTDVRPAWGLTALMAACSSNHDTIAELLLNYGASPDFADNDSVTPLMVAASAGNYIPCDMLIFFKADVNARSTEGLSALHGAALYGQRYIVDLLITKGADVNAISRNGTSVLMGAVAGGDVDMTEFLLKSGANINYISKSGESALTWAILFENEKMVDLLLAHGANTDSVEYGQDSPARIVMAKENPQLKESFRNAGKTFPGAFLFSGTEICLNELSFNAGDFNLGGHFGITEKRNHLDIGIGYQVRVAARRIMVEFAPDSYYQLWARRGSWYVYAGKHFILKPGKTTKSLFVRADGVLTFGSFRAMQLKPTTLFIPAGFAGLALTGKFVALKAGYRYFNTNEMHVSPHRFEISLSMVIHKNNKYFRQPDIYWFQ
ncbi:MAG: ankyrin repeat domain-containing protein [Bacteroidetes bacterium]|nr:ankyrin repeat domain-containing protein [Bacteroidota bacterium]